MMSQLVAFEQLSFAKTLQRHKSRPVTMLQARPHAIHFKRILDFGEGHANAKNAKGTKESEGARVRGHQGAGLQTFPPVTK
jgi:hypothetical protein